MNAKRDALKAFFRFLAHPLLAGLLCILHAKCVFAEEKKQLPPPVTPLV